MPVNPKILNSQINRDVFTAVTKARHIDFRDLLHSLNPQPEKEVVSESLMELEKAGLINVESGSLSDFNVYYVTAEGLQMDRQLRRFSALAS